MKSYQRNPISMPEYSRKSIDYDADAIVQFYVLLFLIKLFYLKLRYLS